MHAHLALGNSGEATVTTERRVQNSGAGAVPRERRVLCNYLQSHPLLMDSSAAKVGEIRSADGICFAHWVWEYGIHCWVPRVVRGDVWGQRVAVGWRGTQHPETRCQAEAGCANRSSYTSAPPLLHAGIMTDLNITPREAVFFRG